MGTPNFDNRTLFHGDNLDFLLGMNDETVDLIATDPPFNKGKDFHATPDSLAAGGRFQDRWSWERDVQQAWVDAIKDNHPQVHSLINHVVGGLDNDAKTRRKRGGQEDMAAFLCFMGVRLIQMRRVLKNNGSIYLHCDPTASHYLKALMDAIFGRKNFRNEIVWRKYAGRKNNATRKFSTQHETLLFYGKTPDAHFNRVFIPHSKAEIAKKFKYADEQGRRYRLAWGRSYQLTGENRKLYLDESPGRAIGNLWVEDGLQLNTSSKERTEYPTQKPVALYERIITASSNPGDMVLDPFCGCATTPIAAERLRRQWVGMDLWDGAYQCVQQRIEDNLQLIDDPDPQIVYKTEPPEREGGEIEPTFELRLKAQRPVERWQRLSHKQIRDILAAAQDSGAGLIACAGCGRNLEIEFMELDHLNPRSQGGENWITNRILLCNPCNGRKSDRLTLKGLHDINRKTNWMKDRNAAVNAHQRAKIAASRVQDEG